MKLRTLTSSAAFVLVTVLLAPPVPAQARNSAPASPYGGTPVEEIIARVNDQIITSADYDRAMKELDSEVRQRGASMQEMSAAHKDLLRNLIDQQLWLSKGKELGVTGETQLINRLNEIRKQYHMESLEDLEKAAQEQGFSYEDFKANIRNQIVTQEVMRQEVGSHITMTPGEVQRYFDAHKQEYVQPESVQLSEILISTGTGANDSTDEQKIAAAKAKADEVQNKLQNGGDFAQLAKSFSDGPNPNDGGSLGTYKRGELNKLFEDAVFPLKSGQYSEPIRTKQGFIIFKVVNHAPGGEPQFKDVEQDVEQSYYMSKMEPAIRDYLTKMREEAYIDIKSGYSDTGASPNQTKPVYSAYTPPSPKKRKKVERTRFRETGRGFREKSGARLETVADTTTKSEKPVQAEKKPTKQEQAAMKAGKKEKIRFGRAPQETLPSATTGETENAGALPESAANNEPQNPLETAPAEKKTRFSARARERKDKKQKDAVKADPLTPAPADTPELANQQVQSAPLGLNGNTAEKKKTTKAEATTGEKTRLSDRKKEEKDEKKQAERTLGDAPAPAPAPAPPQNPPANPQQ